VSLIAIRSALVLLALLIGAWLAFGWRSVRLTDSADAVVERADHKKLSSAEVDAAMNDYTKAGRLTPDQTPFIHQGWLLYLAGRQAEAQSLARRATDAEPKNVQAWYLRFRVMPSNSGEKEYARSHLTELNPWAGYALRRAAQQSR
jgi:hypothetical protein